MKTSYVVLFLLSSYLSYGQIEENFNDGNFNSSPAWQGDTSYFKVNASNELQSQGPPSNSTIYLSCSNSRLKNTEWSFLIRMDFDPSSSNYAKYYLSSNLPDLESSLNGYYLKIGGETGSTDGIDLYKQEGNMQTKLMDGVPGHAGKATNLLRIKVIRDFIGNWKIYSDTLGGTNFIPEGSAFDSTFTNASFSGIVCVHTSTRKDLFFFDDLSIKEAPLYVNQIDVISPSSIQLSFNKSVDLVSSEITSNYLIRTIGSPIRAERNSNDPSIVILTFEKLIQPGNYILSIKEIKDTNNNIIDPNTLVEFKYSKRLNYGDIIITELFPDPSPSEGLPGEEFIEIYNATPDTLDLKGFIFSDGTTSSALGSYSINPSEYIILTSVAAMGEFSMYGKVIGLSPWPSLNNSSDHLLLKDNSGKLLFDLIYTNEWYKDAVKREGGWSLESKNNNEYCAGKNNWEASINPSGGTPGKENSVFTAIQDTIPPDLLDITIVNPSSIELTFDETLDPAINPADISLDNNASVLKIKNRDENTIQVFFSSPLDFQTTYHLTFTNLKDCKGNLMNPQKEHAFILPQEADSLDIIINEILFNPLPGGSDFVEIYNRSDKTVDLKNWQIGNYKNDTISELKYLVNSSTILYPDQYICFTSDPDFLYTNYLVTQPHRIFKTGPLPSYNDDRGTVILQNPKGKTIDRFDYQEEYHFSLIDIREGISLERISFNGGTNDPFNWHSAAETAGWATPGYTNSQGKGQGTSKTFSIDPKVFTPDQDSWKDLAFINYRFNETGYIGNITIYDIKGRRIKAIAKNHLMGTEGFFYWDGTNEEGELAAIGYYIILIEAFNLKGQVSTYKETVVLAGKF